MWRPLHAVAFPEHFLSTSGVQHVGAPVRRPLRAAAFPAHFLSTSGAQHAGATSMAATACHSIS